MYNVIRLTLPDNSRSGNFSILLNALEPYKGSLSKVVVPCKNVNKYKRDTNIKIYLGFNNHISLRYISGF